MYKATTPPPQYFHLVVHGLNILRAVEGFYKFSVKPYMLYPVLPVLPSCGAWVVHSQGCGLNRFLQVLRQAVQAGHPYTRNQCPFPVAMAGPVVAYDIIT
jgi:hypothetical protein